VFVSLEH